MPELTNKDIGSDNPEEVGIPLAVPGEYPEGYEDYPDEWKAAYDHAARVGNTVKACRNTADARMGDEVPRDRQMERLEETLEAKEERIAELEAELKKKDSGKAKK